jgi:glucan phosphoethanolaminetransferase (alkaline phosphatase superfamily)
MTSLDFLYICLALSVLSVAVFINMVLYNIIITIRTGRSMLENVHSYTKDAVQAKDKVKLTVLKGVQKVLSFIPHNR